MWTTGKGRRARRGVAAIVVLATAGALGTAEAAPAAQLKYVALGDSYSAGSGVPPMVSGRYSGCLQSKRNYPKILARRLRTTVRDVTCAGAETRHFRTAQFSSIRPQLDAVRRDTELVTFTIGGNDGGVFFGTFFGCAFSGAVARQGPTCQERSGTKAEDTLRNETFPALVKALRDVRARAPRATVAVLTYPKVMPPTVGCPATMPIAGRDVPYVYGVQLALNRVIRRAAARTGSFLVDLERSSTGHDACRSPRTRWVEPVLGSNPVHPNAAGEKAMAVRTLSALRARRGATTAPVRRATRPR